MEKNNNVKEWYMQEFPSDECGESISEKATFTGVLAMMSRHSDIYDYLGIGDSIIRERIFEEISKRIGCDYDDIYNLWLEGSDYEYQKRWEA